MRKQGVGKDDSMTPRYACSILVRCADEQAAARIIELLQGSRGIRAGMAHPGAPGVALVSMTVRADGPRRACDVGQARLVSLAGPALDGTDFHRSASRLRLVAPFTWRNSTDEGDTWDDGPSAGDREPRRPMPGSDTASS
jgi:hypothetical protein